MSQTIAAHFSSEIEDWIYLINFYTEETKQLSDKLQSVIRRNSIIGIAEKVEAHLYSVDKVNELFSGLQESISRHEKRLRISDSLIENTLVNDNIVKEQSIIRLNMQAAEKELADAKFNCYNFLSKIVRM